MTKGSFYDNFMLVLLSKFSKRAQLTNELLNILDISKEAIYRRLRGDVPFTVEEISVISNKMGISLDNISGGSNLKSRPFYLKLTNYPKPQEVDYNMIEEYLYLLKDIQNDHTTEYGVAAKMIPDGLHLKYENITRFYLFKFLCQYDNPENPQKFQDVRGTPRVLDLLDQMSDLLRSIKSTNYIFYKSFLQNLVNDILYFKDIELITPYDCQLLKQDLSDFLDYLEEVACKGKNEYGNKINVYVSNINFETGFAYIDSRKYKLSLIRSFTLYDASSLDEYTLDTAKKWMHSLIRTATAITVCGEVQRKAFFKRQREIIEKL